METNTINLFESFSPKALELINYVGKGCRSKEHWASLSTEEREARRISNSKAQRKWWAEHFFEEKQERIRGSLEKQNRVFTPISILDNIPQDRLEWLVGFWEGDGGIDTKTRSTTIRFYQKDIELLEKIQSLVGGGYISRGGGIHELSFNGAERSLPFIKKFRELVVSFDKCEKLKKALTLLEFSNGVKEHEPTIPWIVGFFDAEGNSTLTAGSTIRIGFTQKDIKVLEKIKEIVGGNLTQEIGAWSLNLRVEEIKNFLPHYLKYYYNNQKRNKLVVELLCLAQTSPKWRIFVNGLLN